MPSLVPTSADYLWNGIPDQYGRQRGGFYGFSGTPRSNIWKVPGSDAANFNSSPLTVPAYPKFGFLLGLTSSDGSDSPPLFTGITGWIFTRIWEVFDSGRTQSQALWFARPDPYLLHQASGTSLAYQGLSNSSASIAQFYGNFEGRVVARRETTQSGSTTTVTASTPDPYVPGTVCVAVASMTSGGAGINVGADTLMPDIGSTVGLAAIRIGNSMGPYSTTFTSSRSAAWNHAFLLVR